MWYAPLGAVQNAGTMVFSLVGQIEVVRQPEYYWE
jgi:hypothetical protein